MPFFLLVWLRSGLFQCLYTLEIQVSIAFGRPRHLPDGTEVPASSPDPSLMSGDELSTPMYNLARLQTCFHRDMITKHHDNSLMAVNNFSSGSDISWMSASIHDVRAWIADWDMRVESFIQNSQIFPGESKVETIRPLKLCGLFQQLQTLLIAKQATDSQHHVIITDEDELALCKQLVEAAEGLLNVRAAISNKKNEYPLFAFPLAWTYIHSIFSSSLIILRQVYTSNSLIDAETEYAFHKVLKILSSGTRAHSRDEDGLVNCLQNIYNCCHLTTTT